MRADIINYLSQHQDLLAFAAGGDGHIGGQEYLKKMSRPGEWGDELCIRAAAEVYDISVYVYSAQSGTAPVYPSGSQGPHIGLIHIDGNHYEVLTTV